MALVFPDTAATYRAFFKEFADRHKYIQNNDNDRANFAVVSVESAIKGFADNDVRDFFQKLRTGSKHDQRENENNCMMILIEMDGDSDRGQVKMNQRMVNASFAIVTKAKEKKMESRDEAKAICYQVGFDIMCQVKKFFLLNEMLGRIDMLNDETIRIAADDLVGWRFDMSYLVMRDALVNDDMFDGLVVETLSTNDRSNF